MWVRFPPRAHLQAASLNSYFSVLDWHLVMSSGATRRVSYVPKVVAILSAATSAEMHLSMSVMRHRRALPPREDGLLRNVVLFSRGGAEKSAPPQLLIHFIALLHYTPSLCLEHIINVGETGF